ncbi:hypothetical protein ACWJIK_02150 [Corynebacterium minutissimum]
MNRRVVVPALFLCAAPWLSGCQATDAVVDYFGPRADPALASLAQAASADAEALKELDTDAASLRAQQAEELYAEIERLCGRTEEGKAPRSCEVDQDVEPREAADVSAVLGDASASTEEQLDHVAPESRALVVAQAIALEAWNGKEPGDAPELKPAEQDQAAELLEWEYQQVYALDFARSYVTPDLEATIDERLSLHEHRILRLQAALAQLDTVPQPEAAYDSPTDGLPNDADSARSFIDEVAHNDTLKWTDAATHAAVSSEGDSDEEATTAWRRWLIAVAAQSHRFHTA